MFMRIYNYSFLFLAQQPLAETLSPLQVTVVWEAVMLPFALSEQVLHLLRICRGSLAKGGKPKDAFPDPLVPPSTATVKHSL